MEIRQWYLGILSSEMQVKRYLVDAEGIDRRDPSKQRTENEYYHAAAIAHTTRRKKAPLGVYHK